MWAGAGPSMGGQRRHGPHRTTRRPTPRCAARVDRPDRPGGRGPPAPRRGECAARRAGTARRAGCSGRSLAGWAHLLWRSGPSGARARRVAGGLPGPARGRRGPARLVGPRRPPSRSLALRLRGGSGHARRCARRAGCAVGAADSRRWALSGAPARCAFDLPVRAGRIGTWPQGRTSARRGHGRRPLLAVGRSPLWPAAGRVRGTSDQGGVDGAPRRRPSWAGPILRPAQRREALGGAGPGLGGGPPRPRASHRGGRRGDRERPTEGTRADGHRQQRRPGPAGGTTGVGVDHQSWA